MKTIGLSDEAYARLAMLKQHGESFNDLVMRLTAADWLATFTGTLDDDEGKELQRIVEEGRRRAETEATTRTGRLLE